MSGLAALLAGHTTPDVYRWHNAAHVEDVKHAVEHADWRFVYLDGWTVEEKETFLKAAGAALDLPDYGGTDFDQLRQGLSGVSAEGHHGIVLLWDGWSPLARHDAEAFDAAMSAFGERARSHDADKLAVVMRGEGPTIEVPELPDGPH
jgi:Barstar (barnase inhibitor)